MITCKYCGGELEFIGEHEKTNYFYCSFCEMSFDQNETSLDRKRKMSVPESYDENYYYSTKDLLKKNTISLLFLLKSIRADWYELKNVLEKYVFSLNEFELHRPTEEDDQLVKQLKSEYIELTKRKFVIENILLERMGFLPDKITQDFLSEVVEQGLKQSKKPMYIYYKKAATENSYQKVGTL